MVEADEHHLIEQVMAAMNLEAQLQTFNEKEVNS